MSLSGFVALLLVILLLFETTYADLILPNGTSFSIVQLLYKGTPRDLGIIALMVPESPSSNYTDKIVLVFEVVPIEEKWRNIQSHGGLGGVTFSRPGITPGRTEFWSDGSDTSDITILTGELSYSDWLIVNKTLWDPANIDSTTGQPSMIVTIDSWTPNPWRILESPGFIVWQILLVLIHATALVLTIIKFIRVVRYVGKLQLSVVQTVLVLEMIGLIIRLVYLCLDPLGSKKIVHYRASQIFLSVSFPFGIASNLLVLFYWQEIFDKRNMKLSPFLRRLVVPFLVFVALVVLLDLAGSITRGFDLTLYYPTIVIINALIYDVGFLALGIWSLVVARQIFKQFKTSQKELAKTNKSLYKNAIVTVFSGCIYLLLTGLLVIFFIPTAFWNPVLNLCTWFFLYSLFTVRGLLQVFVIKVPKKKDTASTETSGTEGKKHSDDASKRSIQSFVSQKQENKGEDPPSTETFEVKVTNGSDDQEAKVEERHEERPSNDVEDHSSSSDESHSKSTSSESEESAQEDKSNSSNQP